MKKQKDLDKYLSFQRKKYYFKSFFRKAKRLIVDFIPLQQIDAGYCSERHTLRAQEVSSVFCPKDFKSDIVEKPVSLLPVEAFSLRDVYFSLDSNTFLTKNLKTAFYEEVEKFSTEYTLMYHSKNLLFHSEKLAKLNNLPKIDLGRGVLFLSGNFCFNYFHFLIEILSKVEFLKKIPHHEQLLVVTHQKVEEIENMKVLLSFFINENEIRFLSEDHYYTAPKVWHISYPNVAVPNIGEGEEYKAEFAKFSPHSIDYLRTVCLSNLDMNAVRIDPISKVFLARKSQFRKYNEDELLQVAEKYGFQAVYLEDLNIHEQMYLMQNADCIIGPSGAAWTNVLFAQPGKTKGLLWLANVWKEFSIFSTLAEFSGFDLYHWRFGDESLGFHEDYVLDTNEFELQLNRLLAL